MTILVVAVGFCGSVSGAKPMRFHAQLVGYNAGGAAVQTNATGHAVIDVIDDGTALTFKVEVAGIRNLLMAHIHVAPVPVQITDVAGPLAFWFTGGPPPGSTVTDRVNGEFAQGYIITDSQVLTWNAAEPGSGTVAGLIQAIKEGRASVVVHTDDLDANTPTGRAGDSRAGELRGTLE